MDTAEVLEIFLSLQLYEKISKCKFCSKSFASPWLACQWSSAGCSS